MTSSHREYHWSADNRPPCNSLRVLLIEDALPVSGGTVADGILAKVIRSRGNNETILIVDDDDPIRELMRLILENNNYRVLVAASGAEAIKLFDREGGNVKLVLTDMLMPGMDGLSLTHALRVKNASLKVIVCSGADQTARLKEFQALNILNILAKPFAVERLLGAVNHAMAN